MRLLKQLSADIKSLLVRKAQTQSSDDRHIGAHREELSTDSSAKASFKPSDFEFLLSQRDTASPLPGISLVAACMNREKNLMKVLGSWLATEADEIVIVDWSSTSEIYPLLSAIADPRIKVIRIDGEQKWVLSHALNVGLRFASHELVFKIDCDIELSPDFLKVNSPLPGEFVRGFWKLGLKECGEGQQYINGTFGAFKKDLREANYYDERILTYGWDDSDLYIRLSHELGLAGKLINPRSLRHLTQDQEQRIENQSVSRNLFLGRWEPTEFEGAKNKYYTAIAGHWGPYSLTQDYGLLRVEERFYRGRRLTKILKHSVTFDHLSEVLASRDLAVWAFSTMNKIVSSIDEIDNNVAKLLRDAHELNKSRDLVNDIKDGKGVYFIRCQPGPCQEALHETFQVLRNHYPTFSENLFLTENSLERDVNGHLKNVLIAPGELLDKLSNRAGAKEIKHIEDLEELLNTNDRKARYLTLSVRSLAEEAIHKAAQFSGKLSDDYRMLPEPVASSCLITSLYDERNLIRLIEYLACIVINLRVFQHIIIYYEMTSGLLSQVLHEISKKLTIQPGRLLLLPFQKRPTFEELFSIQALLPAKTIIAVSNADITFDATFAKVEEIDLSRNILSLSRRDISGNGNMSSLVRFENGAPNTLSADAWIFLNPCEPDFLLDYQIGTMQCDSFINHQISTSSRYEVINPCFDIKLFHLHDTRFNSSAEKQRRDAEEIRNNYELERARNKGVDPVKGVAWNTLAGAKIVPSAIQLQRWSTKALILNLAKCSEPSFGQLLVMHLLFYIIQELNSVTMAIRLREKDIKGKVGSLFSRYQAHFLCNNFVLDLDDQEFIETKASAGGAVCRTISFEEVAGWIINSSMDCLHSNTKNFLSLPSGEGEKLLRSEIVGDMSTETTLSLLSTLQQQKNPFLKSLLDFFNALPDYSSEKKLLTPFIIPQLETRLKAKESRSSPPGQPSVTFVTSLFKGGKFLPGYLENVFIAAREAGGEVIIIDANMDDNDSLLVKDFLDKCPDARSIIEYVRLDKDPGLYECWKIGIERARADLITNANIDDRRCPHHTLQLVQILDQYPEYTGACGSISCVKSDGTGGWFALEENELWFYNEPIKEIGFADLYRTNERGEVMSRNVMHCMPVWRKSLHKHYGYFDEESYGTSADWAFWLKSAKAGEKFIFNKNAFGRYYMNPESHNRRNDLDGIKELRIIKDFIGISQGKLKKQ